MFKLVLRLFWVIGVLISVGCASIAPKNEIVQNSWHGSLVPGLFTTRDKPLLQEHMGVMHHLRYSAEDTLTSRNLQTGKDVVVQAAPVGAHLAFIATYSDDKNIYVAWRSKLSANSKTGTGKNGDKMVYIARSPDGQEYSAGQLISSGNGAFLPVVTGNKSGDVYVVWQDERSGESYDLYFNVSHDHGATWKRQDVRLDVGKENESFSAEPYLLAEGDSVWLAWVEAGTKGCAVYVRGSTDRGETWNEAVVVSQCEANQALFPQLARSKGRLVAYWFDAKSVRTSASENNGNSWSAARNVAEVEADGVTMQEMETKTGADGTVHLIYGKKGASKNAKANLYYVRAEDGAHFSPPVRLNSGVEYKDSGILAQIALDEKQNVTVIWTDYRQFRSIVAGNYSGDAGKTWGRDFFVDGGSEDGTSQFPHVTTNGANWWVSLVKYSGVQATQMGQGQAVVHRIEPKLKAISVESQSSVKTKNLTKRVNAWWETRLRRDWAGTYALMDPFMRLKNSKEGYVASQGIVNYFAYEVVGYEMTGEREAQVRVRYTSEVPEMVINGKKYSVPKQEVEILQDWIYIDGDWFCLFKDLMGNNFREL